MLTYIAICKECGASNFVARGQNEVECQCGWTFVYEECKWREYKEPRSSFHVPTTAQLRKWLVEAGRPSDWIAGERIRSGEIVYWEPSDDLVWRLDVESAKSKQDRVIGIATNDVREGEIVDVAMTSSLPQRSSFTACDCGTKAPVRLLNRDTAICDKCGEQWRQCAGRWIGPIADSTITPTGFKGGDSLTFSIDGAPTKESMTEALKSMQVAIDNALVRVPQPVTVKLPEKKRKSDPKPPSRHQARLEKHAARRPLPGDKRAKPEGKGRRWFWPAVLALMTLLSGAAAVLTIADRWPV